MSNSLSYISAGVLPIFMVIIILTGLWKKVDVYESFTQGAKGGLGLVARTLPYIVGMMLAVEIFRASGCFAYLSKALSPLFGPLGIPPEVLPLLVIRPFSGSGGLGVLAGLIHAYGPDSYIARVACVYMGSSETLFYVLSLYFGSVRVSRTRYTVPVALAADFFGLFLACLVCK